MLQLQNHPQKLEYSFGIVLFCLLGLTTVVYWPGLTGPLLLDDFWNLEALGATDGIDSFSKLLQFVFSNASGPSGRPLSMLSFLIDGQDWPINASAFKYTNLMLHLLTGTLICWMSYVLSQALGRSRTQAVILALAVSGIWLLHPLNVSTTLYVVQRMTQLMTLFAVAGFAFYLLGRQRAVDNSMKGVLYLCLALFPFGLAAVLSKENGALLLLLIVVCEFTLFRELARGRFFKIWYNVGVLIPLAIVFAFLVYSAPNSMELYGIRHYDMGERLLTELRVLVTYLFKILLPNNLNNGLFHDDIAVSTSLLSPITTMLAGVIVLSLVVLGVVLRKRQPVFSFAVLWFFSLHFLESTYIPLELYFEHRNYFPMVGVLFAAVWYLLQSLEKIESAHTATSLKVFAGFVALALPALTMSQATLWGDSFQLTAYWAEQKPRSIRAQLTYGGMLVTLQRPDLAMERYELSRQQYPTEITTILNSWNHACESGLDLPFAIEEVAAMPDLEHVRDDVNFHLRWMVENLEAGRCEEPDQAATIALFERVDEFELPTRRKAAYYAFYADLLIHYRLLDPALINLRKAFDLEPLAGIPLRQANISASAGRFQDALLFLERAKEADRNRSLMSASFLPDILALEEEINSFLSAQQ